MSQLVPFQAPFTGTVSAPTDTIPTDGYRLNRIASFKGSIAWQRVVPVDVSRWSTDIDEFAPELFPEFAESLAEHLLAELLTNQDKFEWKHRFFGFEIGEHHEEGSLGAVQVTIWMIPYWSLVLPLTLLSAYLLLTKPRKSTQKKLTEPIPNEVA